MPKLYILYIFLLINVMSLPAQNTMEVGTNLSPIVDYSPQWPFKNIMKSARSLLTKNSVWVGGGTNAWDTGYIGQIPKDVNGYPLELPYNIAGAEASQIVHTIWANTSHLPEGTYILLYDGDGDFSFFDDFSVINSQPGRIELQLTHSWLQCRMSIDRSNPSDHVRNIRLLMPGTGATYKENPYAPSWSEKMHPFSLFRYMDWGSTNLSRTENVTKWNQRAQPKEVTFSRVGVPYEVMIDVSNTMQADPWVCIPHRANDEYIRNMARLFRDSLDTNLKVYVEYSNEWWNWIFPVSHYVHDSLDQNLEWPERLAPKLQSVMDIWKQEFANQPERLVRVFGGQLGWTDISTRVLQNLQPNTVDAISPSGYLHLPSDSLAFFGAALTTDDVFRMANHELHTVTPQNWKEFADLATTYNTRLVYYEGGQHFTPVPFGSIQPYNKTLVAVQTDPRMYDLYTELMDTLQSFGHDPLFVNFTSISDTSGQYGTWGALTDQFSQYNNYMATAPKYQALLDFINSTTAIGDNEKPKLIDFQLKQNYPNPFNPQTTIHYNLAKSGDVQLTIYNVLGQKIATLINGPQKAGEHMFVFYADKLPSGMYLYQLKTKAGMQVKKMLLIE